jgi:hypothetical protein
MPHTFGKLLTRVTTLLQTSFQSKVFAQSYRPPKLRESQFRKFWVFNLGVSRQNDIWMLAMWPSTKNTIRGKVVASPKSRPWWVLWVRGSSVQQKCSNYALTNLLFGLCRSVWIIDVLITHPSPHPGAPTRPSTLEVLWMREHTPTLYPSVVFTFELAIKSIKEFRGAWHFVFIQFYFFYIL